MGTGDGPEPARELQSCMTRPVDHAVRRQRLERGAHRVDEREVVGPRALRLGEALGARDAQRGGDAELHAREVFARASRRRDEVPQRLPRDDAHLLARRDGAEDDLRIVAGGELGAATAQRAAAPRRVTSPEPTGKYGAQLVARPNSSCPCARSWKKGRMVRSTQRGTGPVNSTTTVPAPQTVTSGCAAAVRTTASR
jgi:hypothetical protein